jgi:hypothetical protein
MDKPRLRHSGSKIQQWNMEHRIATGEKRMMNRIQEKSKLKRMMFELERYPLIDLYPRTQWQRPMLIQLGPPVSERDFCQVSISRSRFPVWQSPRWGADRNEHSEHQTVGLFSSQMAIQGRLNSYVNHNMARISIFNNSMWSSAIRMSGPRSSIR